MKNKGNLYISNNYILIIYIIIITNFSITTNTKSYFKMSNNSSGIQDADARDKRHARAEEGQSDKNLNNNKDSQELQDVKEGLVLTSIDISQSLDLNDYSNKGKLAASFITEEITFNLNPGIYDRYTHFISLKSSGTPPFNFKAYSSDVDIKQIIIGKNCLNNVDLVSAEQEEYFCLIIMFKNIEINKNIVKAISVKITYSKMDQLEYSSTISKSLKNSYNGKLLSYKLEIGSKYLLKVKFNAYIKLINSNSINNGAFTIEDSDIKQYNRKITSVNKDTDDANANNNNIMIQVKERIIYNRFIPIYFEIDNSNFTKAFLDNRLKQDNSSLKGSLFCIQNLIVYSVLIVLLMFGLRYIQLNEKDNHIQMKISEEVNLIKGKCNSPNLSIERYENSNSNRSE